MKSEREVCLRNVEKHYSLPAGGQVGWGHTTKTCEYQSWSLGIILQFIHSGIQLTNIC